MMIPVGKEGQGSTAVGDGLVDVTRRSTGILLLLLLLLLLLFLFVLDQRFVV